MKNFRKELKSNRTLLSNKPVHSQETSMHIAGLLKRSGKMVKSSLYRCNECKTVFLAKWLDGDMTVLLFQNLGYTKNALKKSKFVTVEATISL